MITENITFLLIILWLLFMPYWYLYNIDIEDEIERKLDNINEKINKLENRTENQNETNN